jgi:hypothetical protein
MPGGGARTIRASPKWERNRNGVFVSTGKFGEKGKKRRRFWWRRKKREEGWRKGGLTLEVGDGGVGGGEGDGEPGAEARLHEGRRSLLAGGHHPIFLSLPDGEDRRSEAARPRVRFCFPEMAGFSLQEDEREGGIREGNGPVLTLLSHMPQLTPVLGGLNTFP